MKESYLFQLDQQARAERTARFVATHCPADDPIRREILHAEYLVRDIIEGLEGRAEDAAYVKRTERLLDSAEEYLNQALASWPGRLQ